MVNCRQRGLRYRIHCTTTVYNIYIRGYIVTDGILNTYSVTMYLVIWP